MIICLSTGNTWCTHLTFNDHFRVNLGELVSLAFPSPIIPDCKFSQEMTNTFHVVFNAIPSYLFQTPAPVPSTSMIVQCLTQLVLSFTCHMSKLSQFTLNQTDQK